MNTATEQRRNTGNGGTAAGRRFAAMLALALLMLFAFSNAATAQSSKSIPQITEFYVDGEEELEVGAKLDFTLEGTARGTASVRISGIAARVPLKEVEPGVYEGSYTVKVGDRISTATTARATLTRRNRSSTALLTEPLGITVLGSQTLPAQPQVLAIESFTVTPLDKLEAGADLDFKMTASPGGQASVNIEGLANAVALRETRSGVYTGSYTIRRTDKIAANARVTGTLVASGRTLRSALDQPLLLSSKKPLIGNLTPADGARLASGDSVSVSGTFDDSIGGVDPATVSVVIGGRDVSRSSVITPQFFNYRSALEPGSYPVVVTAKDRAGNTVRQSWQFVVAGSSTSTSSTTSLPLELSSHQNMASVVTGPIELRGRTAPDASVDVQVTSVSTIFGMLGLSQNLFTQNVRADANGNFVINFQVPAMPKGGGRLQVSLVATKGSQRQTQNLTLVQSQ